MARRSPHAHLKPELFQWFEAGESQADVRSRYPKIPKSTVDRWYQAWKALRDDTGRIRDGVNEPAKPVAVEVVEDVALKPVEPASPSVKVQVLAPKQSDYWRVRSEMVAIATASSDEIKPSVKVQAGMVVSKFFELERDLPQHILEQQTEQSVSDERDRLQDQSVADIAKQYKEAMG